MQLNKQQQEILLILQERGKAGMAEEPKKKKVLSEEHKRHISEAHKKAGVGKWMKGRKISLEAIAKRVEKVKGKKRPPFSEEWKKNIGKASLGRKLTPEHKQKIKIAVLKVTRTPEFRTKMSQLKKGHPVSEKTKNKLSAQKIGDKNPQWKNGATPHIRKLRNSLEYKAWRKAVYERDNYTCVLCLKRGVFLHADHIKPFALYPELRFEISNGRTLCVPCHRSTDTWGSRTRYVSAR